MHLAAALHLPVVLIEGCCRMPLWAPATAHARVVHHQQAPGGAPCHPVDANIARARRAMERVKPTEVLDALQDLTPRRIGEE